MGLFNKIKNMFKNTSSSNELDESVKEEQNIEVKNDYEVKNNVEEIIDNNITDDVDNTVDLEEKYLSNESTKGVNNDVNRDVNNDSHKDVKIYEKGLSKSRKGFVSNLIGLTNRYQKITDEYFDELEEILIMADIGVNTVMDFMDRLRDRVSKENIVNPSELK